MTRFITFEGIEGCGKTTQIRLLAASLMDAGHDVTLTREPGGCPIADQVRAILLDAGNSAMTPLAELLLYAAARAQHIREVVAPALSRGGIVLCDRFTDATLAYQGYGRQLDLDLIKQLNTMAADGHKPGLTLLIDCPVEVGLQRAIDRIEGNTAQNAATPPEDRFELESWHFHDRVRSGYLALAAAEPDRFQVVDGNRPVGMAAAEILDRVSRWLDNRR
jgi:dTMP kinase